MANKIPSRLKTEKVHGAKPYERPRQSLFHKVASTVRDILVPSWLLNTPSWKTSDSEDNESNVKRLETSVQTSKESLNEPLSQNSRSSYISSKRPRYNLTNSYNRSDQTNELQSEAWVLDSDVTRDNVNQTETASSAKEFSQSYAFSRKPSQPTVNGDDQSENSEGSASTSGCSSLVSSQNERQDAPQQERGSSLHLSDDALERIKHELRSKQILYEKSKKDAAVETESVQDLDKSLSRSQLSMWSESIESKLKRSAKPQPITHGQKPSFTLSNFGAPLLGSPTLKERSFESPFYEGNTMFGGASAYRRARLSAHPYQATRTPRSQMKVRETRLGNDTDCMSTTAKRILQTLEKMSTPLSDAKKIPTTSTSSLDLSLSFTPGSLSRRPSLRSLRKSGVPVTSFKGPPVSNVATPSRITVTNNLEIGVNSSCIKKAGPSNRINDKYESSNSKEVVTFTSTSDYSTKGGGKIRARIHQSLHHSVKQKDEESEIIKEPELPNVPLPISTLPKFSFGVAERNNKMRPVEHVSVASESSPTFTFSLPIAHEAPGVQVSADFQKSTSFTFSSPLIVKQDSAPVSNTYLDALKSSSRCFPGFQQQIDKPEIKKKSEAQDANFSLKPGNDIIIGGSVMDILGKPQEPSSKKITTSGKADNTDIDSSNKNEMTLASCKNHAKDVSKSDVQESSPKGFGNKFKPKPGTWECIACMVRNEASLDKCVACESPKPSSTIQKGNAQGFGEKFKPSPGSWECSTCMIVNKQCDLKCVACETSKSGTIKDESSSNASLTSGFADRFKPPVGSWLCPTCLITNNSTAKMCAACETSKPSTFLSTTSADKETTGFGEKFKPPAESWECDTCLVRNISETTKCCACETPRPASKVADVKQTFSGFKFGMAPKTNSQFKFGSSTVSTTNSTSSSTEFKFGTTVTDAHKETNGFKFVGGLNNSSKSSECFKFGVSSVSKSDSSEGFKFGVNNTVTSKNNNKDNMTSASVFKFGLDTSDASKAAVPTFKFGDQYGSEESFMPKTPVTTSNMSFPFGTPSGGNCQASGSFSVSMKPTQTLTTQSKPGCKVSACEAESEPQLKQSEAENTPVSSSSNCRTSVSTAASVSVMTTSLSSAPKFSFSFTSTTAKANKTPITVSSSLPSFSFTCTPPATTLVENKTATTVVTTSAGSAPVQALKTSNAFSFGNKNKSTSSEGFTFKKPVEEKSTTSTQPSFGFFKTDVTTSTSVSISTSVTTSSAVSSTTTSASLFKFGASTSTSFGGGFVFGALKQDADQGTGGGVPFSLGSGTATSNKPMSSAGFGSFAVRQSQPTTSQVPSFSFGSSSLSTVASSTSSTVSVTTSAPSFGASGNVFKFGANSTSVAGGVTPAPVFGASTLSTNSGQPVFGGFSNFTAGTFGQTAQPKQDGSSGFSFGAATPVSAAATAPAPVFRFGAPEDQKLGDTSQNSGFNFTFTPKGDGSSGFPVFSTPPTFNFPASSTPTGPSEFEAIIGEGGPRRIRKAVRRCRNEPK